MLKRNAAVLIIVTVVLGAGAYAWAQGAPDSPTTTTTSQTPGARAPRRVGGLPLRRAVHGDLLVRAKGGSGFENVSFDRGEVTAASASSITVKRPDGNSVTKSIDSDTRFRGIGSADQIKTGTPALVVSKGDKAVVVGQRNPDRTAARRPPNAGL